MLRPLSDLAWVACGPALLRPVLFSDTDTGTSLIGAFTLAERRIRHARRLVSLLFCMDVQREAMFFWKRIFMFVRAAFIPALSIALLTASVPVLAGSNDSEGYYASVRLVNSQQQAGNLDQSLRPRIGSFVPGRESAHGFTGAVAAGYQFGNGWRVEGEYTSALHAEFTSGSSRFPSSVNHDQVNAKRVMLNGYRDFYLGSGFSLYGGLGLGVAKTQSGGWQAVRSRQFGSGAQNNLAYSIGAGVSYAPAERWNIDLGYRYVDMGQTQSGFNRFTNAAGLQDEQLKADLTANEVYLGARFRF